MPPVCWPQGWCTLPVLGIRRRQVSHVCYVKPRDYSKVLTPVLAVIETDPELSKKSGSLFCWCYIHHLLSLPLVRPPLISTGWHSGQQPLTGTVLYQCSTQLTSESLSEVVSHSTGCWTLGGAAGRHLVYSSGGQLPGTHHRLYKAVDCRRWEVKVCQVFMILMAVIVTSTHTEMFLWLDFQCPSSQEDF